MPLFLPALVALGVFLLLPDDEPEKTEKAVKAASKTAKAAAAKSEDEE